MGEPGNRRFIELTQPEIVVALERNPLVLIPAGSVEQHGPHLPTGTDMFASEAIGTAVAERMDGLLLPFCPIGVTPMHMPYEGTLTLSPETYIRLLVEVGGAAASHGAKRLLIINWHEGNIPSIALAADRLHREHGLQVVAVQACYVAEELYGDTAGGLTHGGEIEALAVMATRPELVHLERASSASDRRHGRRMDALRRTRSVQPSLTDIRDIAPTGWYGDPAKATAERGIEFVARVADEISVRAAGAFEALG